MINAMFEFDTETNAATVHALFADDYTCERVGKYVRFDNIPMSEIEVIIDDCDDCASIAPVGYFVQR